MFILDYIYLSNISNAGLLLASEYFYSALYIIR